VLPALDPWMTGRVGPAEATAAVAFAVELHGHEVIVVVFRTRVCTTVPEVTVEKIRPSGGLEVVTVEFESATTQAMRAKNANRT